MIFWASVIFCLGIILAGVIYFMRGPQERLSRNDRKKLMQAVLDHSISCIYVKDRDLKYLFVNKHALHVFGFAEDEVIGRTDEELFPAPYAMISKVSDLKVLEQGMTTKEELVAELRTGNRDFYTIKTPLVSSNGTIYALCGIAMDISKQKTAQRQLNAYLEKLEDVTTELMEARIVGDQVNRSQNAFLASVSHELRTPLNGIIGNTSLFSNTNLDPVQEKYLSRIESSAVLLMGVIEQILDFSKIAAGKIQLELQKCDLIALVKECIQVLEVKAEQKKLELILELPDQEIPLIMADPIRLKEILINLLGNALKFTEKGSVTLKISILAAVSSKILIKMDIIDTGIGIDPEQLTHVFEKFWQGKPTHTGGTGLGLVISKELITLMNGEITVDSTIGEGTNFTIKIPFETYNETP
jgi:PAS domain S-box-containing protein